MTKNEYMEALKTALSAFDDDIKEEIVNDYEEHFVMGAANGKSEEEIVKELGDIDELVEELKSLSEGEGSKNEKAGKSTEDFQKTFDSMLKGFAGFIGSVVGNVTNNAGKFTESVANEAEAFAKEFAAGAEKFVDKSKSFAEEVASSYKNARGEEAKEEDDVVCSCDGEPVESEEAECSSKCGSYSENAKRVIIEADSAEVKIASSEAGRLDFDYKNEGTPNQQLAYKFEVREEGDTVRVICRKQVSKTTFFNLIPVPEITITACIPAGLDRLDVHVVSGDIEAKDIKVGTLMATTVSGDIKVDGAGAGNASLSSMSGDIRMENTNTSVLSVKTVSGDVYFDGNVSNVSAGTTSGDFEIKANGMKALNVNTVSGDTAIELRNATGYRANIKSLSGEMEISLGQEKCSYLRSGSYTLGDGSCSINVASVSGDISINA